MFQRLDARVRLLWWFCISIIAMVLSTAEVTVILIFFVYLGWQTAGMAGKFIRFTIRLVPFLFFISLISLFPTFDLERAIRMSLRYHVLLGATTLVLNTTGYGELTNAIRNLQHSQLSFLSKPLEVFAFVFGLAFSSVPFAAEEWEGLKEAQRARGVDLSRGNKLVQIRSGLTMLQPLILRVFERIKHFCIAVIMYGYNPFEARTLYQPLALSRTDKMVAFVITATTTAGVVLAFLFKV